MSDNPTIWKLRRALLQAFYEMQGDYVDEVWGRDLQYIADVLGYDLLAMCRACYGGRDTCAHCAFDEFIANLEPTGKPA